VSHTSSAPLLSIVICTYNRHELLEKAINSLFAQSLAPDRFEIIIVDNDSNDDTAEVVKALQARAGEQSLQYILEPIRGSGIARYTGVLAARGQWIGFMDDDACASPNWLEEAQRICCQVQPMHGFGGKIKPFYLVEKPDWFKDDYEIRSWGEQARNLLPDEAFAGSNMFFNKETLLQIGPPSAGLGMSGAVMGFGEDTVLFERTWSLTDHAVFYYSPNLVVYHAVPASKMNVRYILERMFMNGASNAKRRMPAGSLARFCYGMRNGLSAIRLLLIMIIKRFSYRIRQQWLVECGGPVAKKMGTATTAMGILVTFKQR